MDKSSSFNPVQMLSSGDMIADRRFDYAMAAAQSDEHAAAIDLLEQVLELVPLWPAAHFALGQSYLSLHKRSEARAAFEQACACDPDDELGASLYLARLNAGHSPDHAPQAYVRALFDQYAGRFDHHLVQALAYQGPQLLRAALQEACATLNRPFAFTHALDLGCGTGLAALELKDYVSVMSGVDLSPAMIAQAKRSQLYHHLETGSLQDFLDTQTDASCDLILAADVFVYMADLSAVFTQAHRCLQAQGLFAFSVQTGGTDGFTLGEDLRFSHSPDYLRDLTQKHGLKILILQASSTRLDRGQPVPGLICVLLKS